MQPCHSSLTLSSSAFAFAGAGTTGGTIVIATGAQIIGASALVSGMSIMFASTERPGNNRVQNKQVKAILRELGLDPKDGWVKDAVNEIEHSIRAEKLSLGYQALKKVIKRFFGL